jgi:hypothetical protein
LWQNDIREVQLNLRKNLTVMFAGAMAVALAGSASATTVYDTTLASPGVYWGTGNQNAGFTVNTDPSGVELALGTIYRFVGAVHPSPTTGSVYNVSTGTSGGLALWDFVFSINTSGGGLKLTDITPTLTILNVGNGQTGSANPLLIPDNFLNGTTGAQNAENLSFSFLQVPLGFDPLASDSYVLTLSAVLNSTGASVGSVQETINATTPIPAALPLFAGGLGMIGLLARRRKRKTKAAA